MAMDRAITVAAIPSSSRCRPLRRPHQRGLYAVRAGAGRAGGHCRRRPQHPGRPRRTGLHRPHRLLRHRRLCRARCSRCTASTFGRALVVRRRARRRRSAPCWRLPAIRVSGPYLAMMTIAFAFIVQHTAIEWREVTGGQNGLMNIPQPALGGSLAGERGLAVIATLLAGLSLYFFHRLARSSWGMAMMAVRDFGGCRPRHRLPAASSSRPSPLRFPPRSPALPAALFAALFAFVAPDSFPFSQSILFLLAVIVGGAGWTLAPVVGAAVIVVLPELIAAFAEYRLLVFGALLLVVLWLAPEGVIGTLARRLRRIDRTTAQTRAILRCTLFSVPASSARPSPSSGLTIAFGGVRAASRRGADRRARPRHRPDRPQRRRQDHRAQHDRRLLRARRRQHPAGRASSWPARPRPTRGPCRHRPHLSDDAAVRLAQRARQRAAGSAARPLGNPFAAGRQPPSVARPRDCCAFVGYKGRARRARRRSPARRPSPGRDRPRARHPPQRAAAR